MKYILKFPSNQGNIDQGCWKLPKIWGNKCSLNSKKYPMALLMVAMVGWRIKPLSFSPQNLVKKITTLAEMRKKYINESANFCNETILFGNLFYYQHSPNSTDFQTIRHIFSI